MRGILFVPKLLIPGYGARGGAAEAARNAAAATRDAVRKYTLRS